MCWHAACNSKDMTFSRQLSASGATWGAVPARSHLRSSWSGSVRVGLLLAAFLLLLALLGMVGSRVHRVAPGASGPAADAGPLAPSVEKAGASPCSMPDVRIERSSALSSTLLPRELRASRPSERACSARC
jgi:hypothetical protein